MANSGKTVIVIGGGVAGLAAASLLSHREFIVTVIERNNRLGGRTFSIQDQTTSEIIDNGQHILMGCYHYTLRWLDFLGQALQTPTQPAIRIPFAEPQKKLGSLTIPNLPMPFHLIAGIAQFENISFKERLLLLWLGFALPFQTISETVSVDHWLSASGQTENLKTYFWNPICLAVMNTSLKTASAKVFTAAIKQIFLGSRNHSRLIVPTITLSELFVFPSEAFIRSHNGVILMNQGIDKIQIEGGQISGILLRDGTFLKADIYISAVPQSALIKIIGNQTLSKYFRSMTFLEYSPIVSVYLWLENFRVDQLFEGKIIGCINTTIQWVFKKSDDLIEITISGARDIVDWNRKKIFELVVSDLKSLFSNFDSSSVRHYQVIKERHATFSQVPGSNCGRPSGITAIKNFYLTGDWTDTGLPATIESAVKSAYTVVDHICELK